MTFQEKYIHITDKLSFYAFCGLFFLIPVATSPPIIVGITALVLWLASGRFIRNRQWLKQKWTLPVILFALLPWAGLLYAEDVAYGLDFAKKSYYWLYAPAIAGVAAAQNRKLFINFFIAGLSFSVAVAVLQYFGLVTMPKGFATGFMGGRSPYITYSLFLVLGILLMSFYFGQADSKRQKVLIVAAIAAYAFNLAIIPGRGGHLAFVVLSPLILYEMLGAKMIAGKRIVAIAVASVALVAIFFSSSLVRDRARLAVDEVRSYYTEGEIETSVGARLYMWDGAFRIFADNPIIGAGTGGYMVEMAKHSEFEFPPDHPHNSYLYLASCYGILGVGVFLWIIWVLLKKGWRGRKNIQGFAVLTFCLVLLMGSMTDTQILSMATGIMFALLTGMSSEESEYGNGQNYA